MSPACCAWVPQLLGCDVTPVVPDRLDLGVAYATDHRERARNVLGELVAKAVKLEAIRPSETMSASRRFGLGRDKAGECTLSQQGAAGCGQKKTALHGRAFSSHVRLLLALRIGSRSPISRSDIVRQWEPNRIALEKSDL